MNLNNGIRFSRTAIAGFFSLSVFFPYVWLNPPTKGYSLFLYLAFVIVLVFSKHSLTIKKTRFLIVPIILLCLLIYSTLLEQSSLSFTRVVASFERVLAWIVAMYIVLKLELFYIDGVISIYKILSILLSLNFLLQVLQMLGVDTNFVYSLWFYDYEHSISYNSATMGRYLGIFNQPLELGVLTGIALIAMSRLILFKSRVFQYLLISCILVSGVLTVSKAFLILAMPIALYNKCYTLKFTGFIKYSIVLILFFTSAGMILSEYWTGFDYFSQLFKFRGGEGLLQFFSGGRFGDDTSDVVIMYNQIYTASPIWGVGLGSTQLMDNGFLEFYYQGGFLSLFTYVAFLVFILFSFIKKFKAGIFGNFGFSVFIFSLLAQVGVPILTFSAFAIPYWAVIFNSLLCPCPDKMNGNYVSPIDK